MTPFEFCGLGDLNSLQTARPVSRPCPRKPEGGGLHGVHLGRFLRTGMAIEDLIRSFSFEQSIPRSSRLVPSLSSSDRSSMLTSEYSSSPLSGASSKASECYHEVGQARFKFES